VCVCVRVRRESCLFVCVCVDVFNYSFVDVFNYSRIVNKQVFDQLGTFILLVPIRSNAISKGFRVKVRISGLRVRIMLRFRVMS
jgi:hypothetical protein